MEADRHHPRQQIGRGLNVRNPRLLRPATEAAHVTPGSDGDRQILMPGKVPVGGQSLVEEEPTHRECTWAQDGLSDLE